jgi:cell wall-associated NlpC family hydrolase
MRRLLALLLLVPGTLSAQTRTVVSGFLAADAGIEGDPLLVGGAVGRETGFFGARLGFGFDVTAPPPLPDDGSPRAPSGIWSTDADALLFLGNPGRGAPIVPYGVAGAGMRGFQADGRLGASLNYSYGAGFRAPLGVLAMEGELRYRESFAEASAPLRPVVASGFEVRVGMAYSMGGGSRGRRIAPPSVPARPPNIPGGAGGSVHVGADARMRIAAAAINTAERHIGVRYTWGGNTPESGFDCSGFIRYVFAQHGVTVPRVSRDQARHGTPLPLNVTAFEPGDILAFASNGREVDHTAIYAGNGRIIHSSSSGGGVRYDDLYSQRGQWYVRHMVAARRVIDVGYRFTN